MASPQKENGYTQVANEILDALARIELPSTQLRMVLAIMRKTYGYHKSEDGISLAQFVEMLGMSRRAIIYNLQDLEAKGIVLVRRSRDGVKNNVNIIKFNKNYDTWVVHISAPQVEANRSSAKHRKQGVVQNSGGSAKPGTGVVQNFAEGSANSLHPQKKYKRNTKETSKGGSYDPLGAEVIKAFVSVDPKNENYYGNTTQRQACDFLIQQYSLQVVLDRIAILPKTNAMPYFPTITTPVQLRDKWVQLESTVMKKKAELLKPKRNVIL
jgi:phage replication O-like protein O